MKIRIVKNFAKKNFSFNNLSIRGKIVISFIVIILLIATLNILLMVTSLSYNEQYDQIVENITMANSINGQFKVSVDSEMWNIVAGKINFEEGKQYKFINKAIVDINTIKGNVKSNDNMIRLEVVLRTIETLSGYVDVMKKQIKEKKKVDENMEVLENIRNITLLIEEDIQEFILYELKESEKLNNEIQESFQSWVVTNIIVLCLVVLFSILAIWIISGSISHPIKELCKSTKLISEGNFDVRVESVASNELDILGKSFNMMAVKVKELIDSNIREQENMKKSELKALQAQINPHFLYNTLDTILWMADSGKREQVKEIVKALSSFFRISLSKGKDFITIKEEIEHISSYLTIQKIRYRNILNYKIIIDERIYRYKILNLTLQPLVENALYHGIKNRRAGGFIEVRGYEKNNEVIFEIMDNGVGMTPEKYSMIIEELNDNGSPKIKESGFGLNNVHKRIKLYYGKDYGISIDSNYKVGTNVYVRMAIRE